MLMSRGLNTQAEEETEMSALTIIFAWLAVSLCLSILFGKAAAFGSGGE